MTQMNPAEPFDSDAAGDYRQQARNFLGKSREYLAEGDLHQASEKGWGAAAWIAKAVAEAAGSTGMNSSVVLDHVQDLTGNDRILELGFAPQLLHTQKPRHGRHRGVAGPGWRNSWTCLNR